MGGSEWKLKLEWIFIWESIILQNLNRFSNKIRPNFYFYLFRLPFPAAQTQNDSKMYCDQIIEFKFLYRFPPTQYQILFKITWFLWNIAIHNHAICKNQETR